SQWGGQEKALVRNWRSLTFTRGEQKLTSRGSGVWRQNVRILFLDIRIKNRRNVRSQGNGCRDPSNASMDELQQARVLKILEAVKSGRLCSLHRLASEFNLSKSHLQHLFKRQTGLSLGHLLVEQRLERAAQLLKSTNMRIKEIAFEVGYE